MRIRRFLIVFLATMLLAGSDGLWAKQRTSKDVKRDKQRTTRQIRQTQKQIEENDRETARQLSRLEAIRADIALRADTIEQLKATLERVGHDIGVMTDSIDRLEIRQTALKANYAKTLRVMRERRQSMSDLSFVFSAETFGQAWRRLRYLNDIAHTSTKQARLIATAKDEAEAARNTLEELRQTEARHLATQNAIQAALKAEQASADNLVSSLRKQGKSLQRELDRRNRQARDLDAELDRIVQEEIRLAEERRRQEEEARKRAEAEAERQRLEAERQRAEEKKRAEAERQQAQQAKDSKDKKDATDSKATGRQTAQQPAQPAAQPSKQNAQPANQATQPKKTEFQSEAEADRRLTGSFASNKGRLLFPVAGKYTIVSNFGTNELPELSKVQVDNLGIDIEVPRGASARSVFEGTVSSIFRLDGYNNIVIVRHGEYLSVYAGIDALSVKKGDKVSSGQALGVISERGDDRSRLHFEIRHEKQKLNPAEWVK